MIEIISSVITNVLIALYQPFWFALTLTVFMMFFYLYAYQPINTGRGCKAAFKALKSELKKSSECRLRFLLIFVTVMILFRTLLNRTVWANPVSDIMGGWWIWTTDSKGNLKLTTECFENILLMLPFIFLLFWSEHKKILKSITFRYIATLAARISFSFSLSIEILQLPFRLGTFQFSDIFYNTVGGILGGIIFWICLKTKIIKFK